VWGRGALPNRKVGAGLAKPHEREGRSNVTNYYTGFLGEKPEWRPLGIPKSRREDIVSGDG
jgi:hypothetical protein